jgi:glycosyltransferase involved in cell wall biosynthesis
LSGKLVLLLPSRIEGMPGVLAEALCLGVPAIAYRVGGVSELENRFSSLICIPSEDSKGLIRAMVEVQDNWEAQLDRSNLDQEKAKQFFSLSRVAKEFLDFYQKL